MQKHVNLVDLVKSFPTNIFLQNLASIQRRTSPIKFAHLAEKSESKVRHRTFQLREGPRDLLALRVLAVEPALHREGVAEALLRLLEHALGPEDLGSK